MPRALYDQASFSAGMLGRDLEGRDDVDAYAIGARVLRNCLPRAQGGVVSRPGTRFVGELPAGYTGRAAGFDFNAEQTYQVVVTADTNGVGAGAIRFYRDSAELLDPTTDPAVAYTIASDYTAAELNTLQFFQSADVMFICCPTKPVRELRRLADTPSSVSWTLTPASLSDGPFNDVNTDAAVTLQVTDGSLAAGETNVDITAISALFASTDVGRQLRIRNSTNTGDWAWATITSVTSDTVVRVTIGPDTAIDASVSGTPTPNWRLGSFSGTTGYPRCGAFADGRLWFGATAERPQTLFGSRSGDFDVFAETAPNGDTADDDAIVFTLDDDRVNRIEWLLPVSGVLLIGTSGGEFVLRSRSDSGTITPTDIGAFRQTAYGSAASVQAVQVGPAALLVQRGSGEDRSGGRRLREMVFRFAEDQYVAPDQTLRCGELLHSTPETLADDLAGASGAGGVVELALQAEPATRLWCLRSDGVLAAFSYEPEQDVRAWSEHVVGGSCPDELGRQPGALVDGEPLRWGDGGGADARSSGGRVRSIAVIRDRVTAQDQLWMVVERIVNGATVRYVEVMLPEPELNDRQEDKAHVDAALVFDGWHAGGATLTVSVDADGLATVTASGSVFSASDVGRTIGLQLDADAVGPDVGVIAFVKGAAFTSDTVVVLEMGHGLAASSSNVYRRWGFAAATELSGLAHLEGQPVAVIVDGGLDSRSTVAAGKVAISTPAMRAAVGLEPGVLLRTMPIAAAGTNFVSRGKKVSANTIRLRLLRSVPLVLRLVNNDKGRVEVGRVSELVPKRDPVQGTQRSSPLATGVFPGNVTLQAVYDQFIELRPSDPLTMRVLEISADCEVSQ